MQLAGFYEINYAWNAASCYIVWLCDEHNDIIFIINAFLHVGRMYCLLSYQDISL